MSRGVENNLAGLTGPFDPANWQNDGRMDPPQWVSPRAVSGRSDVKRFRSKAHDTLIGDNGAIEIQALEKYQPFGKVYATGEPDSQIISLMTSNK